MRKRLCGIAMVCVLAAMVVAAPAAMAAPAERYLHITVSDATKGESVNVNVPLSMAEKILPTLNKGNLHNGHVTIGSAEMNDVDIRALLDALRTSPDDEFVTVKEKDQDVRVAKSNGNLVVHVRDGGKDGEKVDITIPMKVVDALLSNSKNNELDISAAIRALSDAGDALLITVEDASQHVRIWVDSKNASE
ncbi:MAG: hypothetical protein ABSB66_08540 [Candidatus Acidiferrales bacterium]|jgi:hypothetical protein